MAKATLEYDLNDSDDAMAHLRAVKSLDMALAIWEILHNTKKKMEWEIEKMTETSPQLDPYDVIDKVYEKFWEIMDTHGIKIDELIV